MRATVRLIRPSADGVEEVAAGWPADVVAETPPGSRPIDRRPVPPSGLGPNGDVALALLERAARLTPDECGRLEEAAAWRWWSVTPFPGAGVAGARATALVRGRADGRADALARLDSAVRAVVAGDRIAATRGSRIPACISNAGLAVLVRDLIEPETFETLFGPWREVMHH